MPNPLSQVRRDAQIEETPDALNHHPEFAVLVAKIFAHWSHIENSQAAILSRCMKIDLKVGAAMFDKLSGAEARRTILLTAAKIALPEYQYKMVEAAFEATKAAKKLRNDFAHHIWAYSPAVPDALLLMPGFVSVERGIGLTHGSLAEYDRSQIMVYRKRDFENGFEASRTARTIWDMLYGAIGLIPIEQARRLLLREPQFQQAVQRLLGPESSLELRELLRPPNDDDPLPEAIWQMTLENSGIPKER